MKQFSCGTVISGCDAAFTGEREQDILVQVAIHAGTHHGMIEVPPQVVAQVRQNIVEAA